MEKRTFLTKHEVAAQLGLAPETVARMARRGELPASFIAGRYCFHADDFARWLDRQRVVPPEASK